MYLYYMSGQPVRPATDEEIKAASRSLSGVIVVSGVLVYVDHEYEDEDDDDWRQEMAMEAGMLHGINAYNEVMGWDVEEQY